MNLYQQKQSSRGVLEKGVLRNFVKFKGKHLCQSLFFNKVADLNFIKKETLEQVFSCEFYKISKKTFFYRTLPVTASVSTCKKLGYFTDFFWRYDGLKNPAICWLRTLAHISETKFSQIWDLCRNTENNKSFQYRTNYVKNNNQIFQ